MKKEINIKFPGKILHIISSDGFFGAENVVVELSKGLRDSGLDVYIGVINNSYNSHTEIETIARSNNIECVIFSCSHQLDLKTIKKINEFLKNTGIDIVHSHGYKANFYALAASLNLKVKIIATLHNWLRTNFKLRIYTLLDKLLLKKFDAIVAVSRSLEEEIKHYGIARKKLFFVNNGINLEIFNSQVAATGVKRKFNISDEDKIVGTVGRLSEEKGHSYLLEAARKVLKNRAGVKFLIIGDGPLREKLKLKAKSLGLENSVIFTGIRQDIPVLLKIMDIFVLPSLVEAMPMALLEAMASKKPVIATTIISVSRIIDNGNTGMLVEQKNTEQLAESINELLNNEQKASFLAARGYEMVKKEFSAEKMVAEYIKIYNSLIF